MELTENTAARWERIRNETAELASSIASKQEIIKSISSALDELITDFDTERETLEKLRDLADKEMLREESGTLNDETPTHPLIGEYFHKFRFVPITTREETEGALSGKLRDRKSVV